MAVTVAVLACGGGVYYWMHGSAANGRVSRAAPVRTADATSAAPQPALGKKGELGEFAAPVAPPSPLHPGEVLEFTADVAKLSNVANLRLQIVERRNFFGKNAWHLQAFAHTENPLRMVFELDDQFDSYSDAVTLSSLQYEMHLNERGQKQESIQRLRPMDAEHVASGATETRVLPGTRDPLGLMQYLRTVDWTKVHEVRGPVYDGHKLYDVATKLAGSSQNIVVPAGTFDASKLEIRVFDPEAEPKDAELKDAHFALYLANNPTRAPILLEAVMPFATARVVLIKMK